MTAKKYVYVSFFFLLVFSCMVLLFNIVVDPFSLSGAPKIAGFNEYKVDINSRIRLSKAYQPLRSNYQTLIVGNSRVEMGIDPSHSCLMHAGRRAYNLGLPGASVAYQAAAALNLVYQKPIDTVLVSVDFTDFLVDPEQKPSTTNKIPQLTNAKYRVDGSLNESYFLGRFADYYKALFSLDSLVSSFRTVLLQDNLAAHRNDFGFNPAMDFFKSTSIEGVASLFHQKEEVLQAKYSKHWSLNYSDGERSEDFEHLAAFLSILAAQEIKIILFVNPLHERFWALMERNGLMQLYPSWLDEIKNIAGSIDSKHIAFWDFSADSVYIHERLPSFKEKQVALAWFWEPAHYKKELGDLMLQSMLHGDSCAEPPAFGQQVKLTREGV